MEELKRVRIAGQAVPVRGNDIDTDRIIPARFLRCVVFDGLGEHAFEDDRLQLREKGKTHPFDNPDFADATILLVNKNFGCGSSREHAPQSIMRWGKGIKAVIGESFAEIFFGNCVTLGIPCLVVDEATSHALQTIAEGNPKAEFVVNVDKQTIEAGGKTFKAALPEGVRQQFIEGRWDSTAELLEAREQIAATAGNLPYFGHWK